MVKASSSSNEVLAASNDDVLKADKNNLNNEVLSASNDDVLKASTNCFYWEEGDH